MAQLDNPPQFSKVMALLSPVRLPWQSPDGKIQYWSIGDWGKIHRTEIVKRNRNEQKEIRIFNTFVAALLQGARTKGQQYGQRIQLMNKHFHDFSDVTRGKAEEVLAENGYALINRGVNIILEAKGVVLEAKEALTSPYFPFELYFQEAEHGYEDGFGSDPFLKIKGVGRKVRDFALSQFSFCYCAIDRHVADVLTRTGLIIHGYGDLDFGTNPSDEANYKFMQRLVIQFSKETKWSLGSSQGWAPSEIDSSLWFFGQRICRSRPECRNCPIKCACLTYQSGVK